jgi:hypothetical protein
LDDIHAAGGAGKMLLLGRSHKVLKLLEFQAVHPSRFINL